MQQVWYKFWVEFSSLPHSIKMVQSVNLALVLGLAFVSSVLGQLDHFLPPPPARFNERQILNRNRPQVSQTTDLMSR